MKWVEKFGPAIMLTVMRSQKIVVSELAVGGFFPQPFVMLSKFGRDSARNLAFQLK